MSQRVRMFFLFPLLPLIILAMVFLSMKPLSPSTTHAVSGRKFPIAGAKPSTGYQLTSNTTGNLTYHNGPVMAGTAHVYLIFWEPTGSVVSPTYNQLMIQYFTGIGKSALYHNNIQYTDSSGKAPKNAVYSGQFIDSSPYPANPMTDAQVQAEVAHAISAAGWTVSIDTIFFVFTASGEHNTYADANGFCAYHSAFGTSTIYAAMIYPTVGKGCETALNPSPNNDQDADSEINWNSHEQMEAATDPLLNAWYFTDVAHEIGDQCDLKFGPPHLNHADITFGQHHYYVQKEWDNTKSGCFLAGP